MTDYDALKWHYESKAAGESFVVPARKIYEVYVGSISTDKTIRINGWTAALTIANTFCPMYGFQFINSINGVVNASNYYGTLPNGWILTEGDIITTLDNSAFVVRWRDITEQQLDP